MSEFDGQRLARMFEAEVWDGPLWMQGRDACVPVDPDPWSTYMVPGAEIPLSTLARIDECFDR